MEFAGCISEAVAGAVFVLPAALVEADAFDGALGVALVGPLLLVLIGAVTGEAAGDDLRLPIGIALGVHLANLDGLGADDADDLVGINVAVAVVVGIGGGVGGQLSHINLHQVSNQQRHYAIMT